METEIQKVTQFKINYTFENGKTEKITFVLKQIGNRFIGEVRPAEHADYLYRNSEPPEVLSGEGHIYIKLVNSLLDGLNKTTYEEFMQQGAFLGMGITRY